MAARATSGELSANLVQAIRTAASGWFGIGPDDVTIIDLNGNVTFGGDRATREPNGPQTEYAEAKRWYENYWKQKIQDCLAVYPGVVVGVNVELDPELGSESRKVVVDPQPTALESNTYRKTSENRPSPGGRPGAVPNEVPSNTPRDIASISRSGIHAGREPRGTGGRGGPRTDDPQKGAADSHHRHRHRAGAQELLSPALGTARTRHSAGDEPKKPDEQIAHQIRNGDLGHDHQHGPPHAATARRRTKRPPTA